MTRLNLIARARVKLSGKFSICAEFQAVAKEKTSREILTDFVR
ncbi:hypothetical protein [Campylobacter gracilis]|nr:hypothetical protein [Campylobacter gracilis]